MKKLYTLLALGGLIGTANAQTFTDDFEGYNPGDYIGVQNPAWTTWSGATGGAEDVQVVTNQALSGSNSVYFSSTVDGGGPQDVVLPFGGEHNLGQFTFELAMYVEANKGAYFNLQGDATIGSTWALSMQVLQDGSFYLYDGNGTVASGNITQGTWFTMTIDIDFNINEWECLVDGNSIGTWSGEYNQVASLDLFPVNGSAQGGNSTSGYWVDDVMYNVVPYTLPNENGAVLGVGLAQNGLVGQDRPVAVDIRNLGVSNITSFDMTIDYNGGQIVENVTGVNIASLGYYTVNIPTPIALVSGQNTLTATISNVNGNGPDGDANDDIKSTVLDPVTPADDKVVIGEEATGTWCGWCPRGTVAMEAMANDFPDHYQGIAVHNSDPMADATYDAGMGSLISGYPSALVDRVSVIDPSDIEADFLDRIIIAPTATITPGATWDAGTRVLNISLTADWLANASGNWRMACVLVEDGVTGGSGYAQTNYYAGGGNGVMGGYELLPDPVPAGQMVYDDVARLISPGFAGYANSFPASVSMGESHTLNFSFQLDAGWDENEITIVGMLIDPSGDIDNGGAATITEAETNGYLTGTNVTGTIGVSEFDAPDAKFTLYPNPTSDVAFANIQLDQAEEVSIRVMNLTGQLITSKNYGTLEGAYTLPIPVRSLASGVYMIEVTTGTSVHTERLIVE